jgi:hypothetical protein
VSQVAVDAFDADTRCAASSATTASPEMQPAPYRREHVIASVIERLARDLLKVDRNRYGAEVAFGMRNRSQSEAGKHPAFYSETRLSEGQAYR